MRIGIVYGHISSNLGDVAINHGTAAMLRRVAPDAHVHVVLLNLPESRLPEAEAAFAETKSKSFGILRTRDRISQGLSKDYSELSLAMEYVLNPARFIEDTGLSGCNVVLYNSGEHLFSYENDDRDVTLLWRLLPALAAKSAGMRFIVLPATVGPFDDESLAPMLRAFFTISDDMAVRETSSAQMTAQFLGGAPPPVLLDPAFFVPTSHSPPLDDEAIMALVLRLERFGLRVGRKASSQALASYREAGFKNSASFRLALAATRSFLDHAGHRVRLIIANNLADRELMQAISAALAEQGYGERVQVVQPASVSAYHEELARASFILASRFHAAILGLLSGRPVMGVYFDEHGHKMPGLFQVLGVSDYCCNLSQTTPEALAEAVVPLFLGREKAFLGVPERLRALQEESITWLKDALQGEMPLEGAEVTAASLDYVRGIEALRLRSLNKTVREQAEQLEAEREMEAAEREAISVELDATVQQLSTVQESFSYKLGYLLVSAVRYPGLHSLLLPYRAVQLLRANVGRHRWGPAESRNVASLVARRVTASTAVRAKRLLRDGKLRVWMALAKRHNTSGYFRQSAPLVSAKVRLLEHGFQHRVEVKPRSYQPEGRSVFYLLHNSLPYATGGYSIRTHGLLRAMIADGWRMYGVTRPGFPFDINVRRGLNVPELSGTESVPDTDLIDDVTYLHILDDQRQSRSLPVDEYLQGYIERVLSMCSQYRPVLLHGVSDYRNGIVAAAVGRALRLPSVYSVRGLWEITHLSNNPGWADSDEYRMTVRMETDACLKATAVIAITEALKNVLVERGVPCEKIQVVPNGVDTSRFVPIPRDRELEALMGFSGKKVIGYVGAFAPYEGLEYLLQAAAVMRRERDDFRLLLVGDGVKYEELQTMCDEMRLRDIVTIVGRVPNAEIERYYSLVDIVPLPRKGVPVCEIVSPLKPFEAMSMGKVVVASNVAALAEIVCDGETGLLHNKDDAEHLAHCLEILLDDPELMQSLGEAARRWVVANRDWRILAGKVGNLYRSLIEREH